jgi:hypothetical protein
MSLISLSGGLPMSTLTRWIPIWALIHNEIIATYAVSLSSLTFSFFQVFGGPNGDSSNCTLAVFCLSFIITLLMIPFATVIVLMMDVLVFKIDRDL